MSTNARTLIRYIFPALGGLFVTYLYNVVDGIFVGQGVGSAALGAVNIAVSRGIAVKALMIFCLPMVFGAEAVWLAPLVTELVTLAAAVVLNRGEQAGLCVNGKKQGAAEEAVPCRLIHNITISAC